ncbi:hypothetical protein [Massilia sp. BHUDP2]|uniref:hypothetical protein n=1 Tax=Massilia sp. BHUDP2 TaxID=3034505 RepID=UPI0039065709
MTERRATITLSWRPGMPTRREDDYREVTHFQPVNCPRPASAVQEQRAIESRLINWSRWTTAPMHSRVASSQTGAICDRLRRAALGDQDSSDERRKIDENDALLIERNLWKLRGTQRSLLRMHYVNNWRWPVILRMLRQKVRKAHFDILLANAQEAIEYEIDNTKRAR